MCDFGQAALQRLAGRFIPFGVGFQFQAEINDFELRTAANLVKRALKFDLDRHDECCVSSRIGTATIGYNFVSVSVAHQGQRGIADRVAGVRVNDING